MVHRFATAAALALVALSCSRAPARPEKQDFWYLDLERAEEAAAQSGLPLLVVFR